MSIFPGIHCPGCGAFIHAGQYGCMMCGHGEPPDLSAWSGRCDGLMDLLAQRTELAAVLREHFLAQIICDHDKKQDNPVCACSKVHLGWHPSVGAAVNAWVEHVMEHFVQRASPNGDGEIRQK